MKIICPFFNTYFIPFDKLCWEVVNWLEINEEEKHLTMRTPVIAGGSHFVSK